MNYYIASCVFTARFPELSHKIQTYISTRRDLSLVRCCVPKWKIAEYEEKMPEGVLRDSWKALPETAPFAPGDEIWSLCHNCSNIIEESRPGTVVHSLWELIDQDDSFVFSDYSGLKATVQDCWRSRERVQEQDAVRSLLHKMNVEFLEAPRHHAETDFCGASLYRPQVARNPMLAPRHYRDNAQGLFLPHTSEEQEQLMKAYCAQYTTSKVICYCHYCLEGLQIGGVDGLHLAQLLFQ